MFSAKEIGIKLTLKNEATKPLDGFLRDLRSWEKKATDSIFSVKNAFAGFAALSGFKALLRNSDELQKSWDTWKKSVMDRGPTDALQTLGAAVGDLMKEITGGEDSASSFAIAITTGVKGATLIVAGLVGAFERMRQAYNNVGATLSGAAADFAPANAALRALGVNADERRDAFNEEAEGLKQLEENFGSTSQKIMRDVEDMTAEFKRLREEREKAAYAKTDAGKAAALKAELDAVKGMGREYREAVAAMQMSDKEHAKAVAAYKAEEDEREKRIKNRIELEKKAAEEAKKLAKEREHYLEDQYKLSLSRNEVIARQIEEQDRAQLEYWASAYNAAESVHDVIANKLIEATNDWVEGELRPGREYLKDIAQQLANMALQMGMKMAFQAAFNVVGGAFGVSAGAEGGVFNTGGLRRIPLQRFAQGGIADGPTLALGPGRAHLYGEGGVPEAYVPLPGGDRRIPVRMETPPVQQTSVTFVVQAMDRKSVAQFFEDNGGMLANAIARQARRNSGFLEQN